MSYYFILKCANEYIADENQFTPEITWKTIFLIERKQLSRTADACHYVNL